ncbi:Light-sensor Protein kinase [Linum perenne]
MEQFRHVGEVLGSLKALMVLQDNIQINPRQCGLLLQMFTSAFDVIAEEIKHNLTLEEKNTKWKPLEEPLRELHRVFKEGELYVRHCMDNKDWWGKALSLHQNKDSVEFHIHNLITCFPAVIEAIETAGEISGLDEADMKRKRVMLSKKYDRSWYDPKLFQWRFGRQYLIPREICCQFKAALREDKWHLIERLKEKKASGLISKNEHRLADLLLKKLNSVERVNGKLPPSSILLGGEEYKVRRRLGEGSQYKEIQWLGEVYAMRHLFHEIEPLSSEIYDLMSLAHPNIVQYYCGFYDEDKKECFLVMELMSKDLYSYMKENSSPRKRVLLPLPIVVDIMLQVARGMEFLHSKKIYHGDLNITNIFLKPRKSTEGYFSVKVSGFGLTRVENQPLKHASPNPDPIDPTIWYAPEVLAEQEKGGNLTCKYSEKADVYSFGMLSFGLLTGKLPFEDGHLHGDQMIKNIRAGERPLFPYLSPKYLVNLTKKCWHKDPSSRPSFTSICRILRYVKKFLVMNPSDGQPDMHLPPVEYTDLEAGFLKMFPAVTTCDSSSVSQIPFQMFAYRLVEREKTSLGVKFKQSEAPIEAAAPNGHDESLHILTAEDAPADESRIVHFDAKSVCMASPEKQFPSDTRSVLSEPPKKDPIPATKKPANIKVKKTPGKFTCNSFNFPFLIFKFECFRTERV